MSALGQKQTCAAIQRTLTTRPVLLLRASAAFR